MRLWAPGYIPQTTNRHDYCNCPSHYLLPGANWTRTYFSSMFTQTHHVHVVLLYNSPASFENGLDREWEKVVVISSPCSHKHTMHFCTTHLLRLRMDWTGNNQRQYSFIIMFTQTHHMLLYTCNSPPKVKNGLDREQEMAVILSSHTFTYISCISVQLTR